MINLLFREHPQSSHLFEDGLFEDSAEPLCSVPPEYVQRLSKARQSLRESLELLGPKGWEETDETAKLAALRIAEALEQLTGAVEFIEGQSA